MAMNRNRFKYSKPKSKPESRGYWIEARRGEPDNLKLVTSVTKTCLNEQVLWQNYQIASTSLYISTQMEQSFTNKEKELEGLLKEKPPQMFAFGLVRTKPHADEVVEKSAFDRQILHVPLGDPSKGVNVVKHADVLMTFAAKKRCQRPWLIVYRVMVGRSKNVKPRFVSQAPQVNPTPNADSHVCKDVNTKSDLVLEQLNQSQIFLYELDKEGRPSKHPRHCLPYAVICWKQREVPLTLTPTNSANSRWKTNNVAKTSTDNDSDATLQQSLRSKATIQRSSSLLQEEYAALSRSLEKDSLTFEDLNSNELDSKLNDIKKEREEVMKKLKAIQSMREVLTSGSCSSESEQEIDKALSKIKQSSGKVDVKIARSMSSSDADAKRGEMEKSENHHPSNQDGSKLDRSTSLESGRPERIASTSGWRDPYHWAPYQRNDTNTMFGCSSTEGQNRMREFDYYQTDEQSEMFDLEEMLYAGKIPQKEKTVKPLSNDDKNAPGSFHDDVVLTPKPKLEGKNDVSHPMPPGDENTERSETPMSSNSESNLGSGAYQQGMLPISEVTQQKHRSNKVDSDMAGGDNIPCQVSCDSDERSSNPNSDAIHQSSLPKNGVSPQSYSNARFENMAGGDSQLSSNIQVQDMDIDESSQSSNSLGSHINPITSQTYQAIHPPAFTSQSFPAVYASQSYNSSCSIISQSYTNLAISSIPPNPIGVPPPLIPTIGVPPPPIFPMGVPPPPFPPIGVPPPPVTCNNAPPVVSQDYNNSYNYESSLEGIHTSLAIPPQQYCTQELPNSDPPGDLGTDTPYQPPECSTPSSSDTPSTSSSDFNASKVISRDADGRLRLGSQADSPIEVPKVVFRRPPSPSVEQFPEGKISPPVHMKEDGGDGPPVLPEKSNPTDAAQSAIEALQKQLINTNNPTQAHALQMIMNTLLTKIVTPPKEDASKSATGDVQSKSGCPLKTSDSDASISKSKKPAKMFHGHPLIKKGKKAPRPILLEQHSSGQKPVDPRPARSSLFGRKFEVSLDMVPWAKTTHIPPITKQSELDHSKKKRSRKQSQTNLRDPRIQKQALPAVASAPNEVVNNKAAANINQECVEIHQESKKEKEASPKQVPNQAKQAPNEENEIKVLGTYRSCGRDTPESGELSDSPARDDVRTVVLQRDLPERLKLHYQVMDQSREGGQQNKILDKFKYVQNINASIPEDRKVEMIPQPQDTVFDRLGAKRRHRSDENKFDLRHKISGKKPDALTGYNIRDQFVISESSNDSSVMEAKSWSPPLVSSESFTDSFKWYDRKPQDRVLTPEPSDEKYRERRQSSVDRDTKLYLQDRDKWSDQQLSKRNQSDGFSRERATFPDEWDMNPADRNRFWDSEYWERENRRRQDFYDHRNRDGYRRERSPYRYSKQPYPNETLDRPLCWQQNQRSISPERSRRSLSKDRSSRSYQRHSFSEITSWRDSCRDRSHSSSGIYPRDRSSLDRHSRASQRSRSRDRASTRSESSMSSISLESVRSTKEYFTESPISWESIRRPPSRNSSLHSAVEASSVTTKQSDNLQRDSNFGSLDERLEREHGIAPAKKRKLSTDLISDKNSVGSNKKEDGSVTYKNLCTSLATLKQSVTHAVRSFRDLNRYELKARIERYQERYKKLQDMAIRAMEIHYEHDRVPTELDRDIQQRLLEMITDIEGQREGLDKYKTSSEGKGKDSYSNKTSKHRSDRNQDAARDKRVSSRPSSDLATQVYDRRQNRGYSTCSPARSGSGSSQKKRCP